MNAVLPPLVTVLTPVYNGEKYLSECIESVLAQTYQHWEYVIVNNCSTDRSLEIAQAYARRDPRIRIHNNDHFVRVIENHNIAFRQVSGRSKYCKVVHADDWLFPECIFQMVKVAEENPSVGIVGSYGLAGVEVTWDGLPYPSTVIAGRSICRSTLLGGPYVFGAPTSLLFRSDLIRGREAFFNEAHIGADTEACYEVLQNCDFGFVHQVLTYTRKHSEALTSVAERMNSYILGQFILLKKYGPVYLSNEEYETRLKLALNNYYSFLGKSVFQLREKAFWDYHRRGLEGLGYPFSVGKLVNASLRRIIGVLLYPVRAIGSNAQSIRVSRQAGK